MTGAMVRQDCVEPLKVWCREVNPPHQVEVTHFYIINGMKCVICPIHHTLIENLR